MTERSLTPLPPWVYDLIAAAVDHEAAAPINCGSLDLDDALHAVPVKERERGAALLAYRRQTRRPDAPMPAQLMED